MTAADLLSLQRVEVLAAERFNELGMSEIAAHPPTDLAPELQAVRRGEAERGLRIEERVIMSRALGRP